jgi:phosphate transport system substrate-binding protein
MRGMCPGPLGTVLRRGRAYHALLVLLLLSLGSIARAASQQLTETGSTLMLPLMQRWAEAYGEVSPDTHVATAGTDSGAGIAAAIDGSAQVGASDAYMSDVDVARHPGILNIPLAISAQTVNYNLAGLTKSLRMSGPVLASIYAGSIRDWSDPAIAALNPGTTLPHHLIVPIHRSDASGDTFIFTQFLSFSAAQWDRGPGFGTLIRWPDLPGALTATGNPGMVQTLSHTPYGVAYIGGSFADDIAKAELGTAELQNDDGKFVLPKPNTITAAAAALTPRTPADERLTLVLAPGGDSYPLINYEYAIVRVAQPNAATAEALRNFLLWTVTPGQGADPSYLSPLHFIPLPPSIQALSTYQIAKIH